METSFEQQVPSDKMDFYSVSSRKFLILFLGTFGIYTVYWFYKHWSNYKLSSGEDIWPAMRAIFPIFFAHSLFSLFEMKYESKTGEAPRSSSHFATLFVVISIVGNIGNQMANHGYGLPLTIYSGFIALPLSCWALYKGQSLANYASSDVEASSNNKLTFVNYLWLVFGALFWMTALVGTYALTLKA